MIHLLWLIVWLAILILGCWIVVLLSDRAVRRRTDGLLAQYRAHVDGATLTAMGFRRTVELVCAPPGPGEAA